MTASTKPSNTHSRPMWLYFAALTCILLIGFYLLAQGVSQQTIVDIVQTNNGWSGTIDGHPIKCGPGDTGNQLDLAVGDRGFSEHSVNCSNLDNIKNALMRILIRAGTSGISQIRAAEIIFAFGKYMATLLP